MMKIFRSNKCWTAWWRHEIDTSYTRPLYIFIFFEFFIFIIPAWPKIFLHAFCFLSKYFCMLWHYYYYCFLSKYIYMLWHYYFFLIDPSTYKFNLWPTPILNSFINSLMRSHFILVKICLEQRGWVICPCELSSVGKDNA